jgi:hypothetical protein
MKRRMLKAGLGEETPLILICQDQLSYTTVHQSTLTLNKHYYVGIQGLVDVISGILILIRKIKHESN